MRGEAGNSVLTFADAARSNKNNGIDIQGRTTQAPASLPHTWTLRPAPK